MPWPYAGQVSVICAQAALNPVFAKVYGEYVCCTKMWNLSPAVSGTYGPAAGTTVLTILRGCWEVCSAAAPDVPEVVPLSVVRNALGCGVGASGSCARIVLQHAHRA